MRSLCSWAPPRGGGHTALDLKVRSCGHRARGLPVFQVPCPRRCVGTKQDDSGAGVPEMGTDCMFSLCLAQGFLVKAAPLLVFCARL